MMKKNSQLRAILTALVVVAIAAVVLSRALTAPASAGVTTVSVIVELRDEPGAVYKARTEKSGGTVSQDQLRAYRDGLTAKQDAFLASLAGKGISATIVSRDVKNYDGNIAATVPLRYSLVYNGMAMKVNQDSITALRNMPEVKSVHADETLITSLNNSVSYIGAPKVYGNAAELTQFDTLNEGYEGQGMYVSIIDTGIDWTHPMFGGDPTPPRLAVMPAGPTQSKTNQKVVYYLPLTDLAVEDGFGHGTHVAATVAGYLAQTLDGVRLHGVAPQAKLMSYKVCSDIKSTVSQVQPIGGCESSDTMMALEDSVSPFTLNNPMLPKPVAHVINMSLGGGGGPDNPTAVAASNAALMGTVVVASSGNSGPGEGTTGSPAAGTHVISVGANTHPGSAGSVWSVDVPGHSRMKLLPMQGSPTPASPITAKYVYVDSWSELGPFPANVRGRIALVKDWAGTTFFDMSTQATAAGAVALIFIREDGANAVKTTIPSAVISTADGQAMINALSASDNDNPANGAISDNDIKLNGFLGGSFMGDMASFSSRGPVRGLGQIKPDISAPGVAVLAACPPASLLGALAAAANPTSPNYIAIDGTSMSSPHAAGAVTLIKQAHLNWSPDVIRTVLINTATNMRDQSGATKKADGLDADSIIAQGGGLIDVPHAVKAKAAMGVTGDGISQPGILGSYSFGEVPVVNNRITHTAPITVTIRDLSGQGGTYNLNVANNRDLQLAGISVTTSQSTVSVPANGSATFTVNATFDGDQIRDVMAAKTMGTQVIFEKIQMQWFVTATGSNNESLRMPFFFRPGNSLPAQPNVQTLNQTATVPTGAYGVPVADGVTEVNVPFEVSASTFQIEAYLEWFTRPTGSQEDIDYELLDPDGNVIASSGGPAGASESVKVRVNRAGTYVHRVLGFVNAATDVNITTKLTKGPDAPTAQTIPGDFVDSQSRNVDFDGSFTVNWTGVGGEQGYEVQQSSSSNPEWQTIATVDAGTTSYNLTNLANDTYSFRVRGIHPGQIGKFVTNAGNEISVLVDQRSKVDITNLVTQAISNVSLSGGVFQLDLAMTSNSTQTYIPLVDLNVIGVNSASGTVKVINADNGRDGKSAANAALFSYSQKLGADQLFSPAEVTGTRTFRFQDSAFEMFTFDAVVTGYLQSGAAASGSTSSGSSTTQGSSAGGDPLAGVLTKFNAVMRFTANPVTKTVSVQLVSLK